jgi:MFS family permease
MLPALQNKQFRIWLIGVSVANIGTWMQRLAQEWEVLTLSHKSAAALGLVTGLQYLPILLIGPIGGVLADRYSRRSVLMAAQLTIVAGGIALGLVVLSGHVQLWHVYLFALAIGIAGAVFQPTSQAFLTELVGEGQVPSVVALAGGSFHVARLVGPGLAGALIGLLGTTAPAFLVAAAAVSCSVVALLAIGTETLRPGRAPAVRGMFAAGVRYGRGNPDVRLVLAIMAFVGTFAANTQVTNALMATRVYGVGAGQLGLLGSILAVGSVAGAAVAVRRRAVSRRFVIAAALAFSVANLVSGLMPGYWWFAGALVLVGVSQLTYVTAANSLIQIAVDPSMRGRILGMYMMLLTGSTTFGAPLLGWVAQQFGARAALTGSGLIAAAGTVMVASLMRGWRRPVAPPVTVAPPAVDQVPNANPVV